MKGLYWRPGGRKVLPVTGLFLSMAATGRG